MSTPSTAEGIALALMNDLMASEPGSGSKLQAVGGTGFLADTVRWLNENPEAGDGILSAALRAEGPLGEVRQMFLLGMGDLLSAHVGAGSSDALLTPRPARTATSPGGLRIAFLTRVTDGRALLRELLGRVPQRPIHRHAPPEIPRKLAPGNDVVELAASLGVDLKTLGAVWRRPANAALLQRIARQIVQRLATDEPALGPVWQALQSSRPEAALTMPPIRVLLAMLRGVRRSEGSQNFQCVQTFDLGLLGSVAIVVWDPQVRSRRARSQFAAHVRYLCDRQIAPWLQWSDERRRREGWYLYVHHAVMGRPQAEKCAAMLRDRHPAAYVGEPAARTLRRLYRLSGRIREAEISRLQRRQTREAALKAPSSSADASVEGDVRPS